MPYSEHKTPAVSENTNNGNVNVSSGQQNPQSLNYGKITYGVPGKSAYQSWLDQGNTGTEQDFLASIGGIDVSVFNQRVTDLEEATDGLHLGVEPLQYYIIARDN